MTVRLLLLSAAAVFPQDHARLNVNTPFIPTPAPNGGGGGVERVSLIKSFKYRKSFINLYYTINGELNQENFS